MSFMVQLFDVPVHHPSEFWINFMTQDLHLEISLGLCCPLRDHRTTPQGRPGERCSSFAGRCGITRQHPVGDPDLPGYAKQRFQFRAEWARSAGGVLETHTRTWHISWGFGPVSGSSVSGRIFGKLRNVLLVLEIVALPPRVARPLA